MTFQEYISLTVKPKITTKDKKCVFTILLNIYRSRKIGFKKLIFSFDITRSYSVFSIFSREQAIVRISYSPNITYQRELLKDNCNYTFNGLENI